MNSADPPRLVLRFGVYTCVALALAAAAVLMVVRHLVTVQAEHAATTHARVLAASTLRTNLVANDFDHQVGNARRAVLDHLFQTGLLEEGVLRVELLSNDGTVTYSTAHRRAGIQTSVELIREARTGTVRSDTTRLPNGPKALRTYAPVAVSGGNGVIAIIQDYRPIARAAASTFLPTAGVFEAALILLCFASADEAVLLAERLHKALERAFTLHDFPLEVMVSIGIAVAPEHGNDVDTLLRHADVAMYLAKEAHAGTAVYDS